MAHHSRLAHAVSEAEILPAAACNAVVNGMRFCFDGPGTLGRRGAVRGNTGDSPVKKKTLKQEAAESLRRRAGQYERHGKAGIADILREAAKKLLGIKSENNDHTWKKGR